MVRKRYNAVKRTYTRARGGIANILQNPIAIGVITGAIKNMVNGQSPLNVRSIQRRVAQPNAKNPLIYLLAGYFLHNKPLMTIGAFLVVDPPVSDDNIDTLSDEEIEALSEEIGEDEDEEQKICIH